MLESIQLFLRRRSIRHYQAQPVSTEVLELLLQAGMAAPTACNSQPWEFVVITEVEKLDALRARLRFARYNAPAAIVVCGNLKIAHNSTARHFWVQDCSAVIENILLAATALSLGSVWIGIYPLPSLIKPVQEILNIPEEVTPLGMVYVGYPAEEKAPHTKYDAHRIHWQEYEPKKRRAKKKNAKYAE